MLCETILQQFRPFSPEVRWRHSAYAAQVVNIEQPGGFIGSTIEKLARHPIGCLAEDSRKTSGVIATRN
jgi:hypothetical protein